MADKYLIVDNNSFANEAVRGDLAARSYDRVFLYFDKRADPRVIPDGAAIQVHLIWMMNLDVGS
jgi:hypothetical protein